MGKKKTQTEFWKKCNGVENRSGGGAL